MPMDSKKETDSLRNMPPVFLLKTSSTPRDMYEEYFRKQTFPVVGQAAHSDGEHKDSDAIKYNPIFVPVLSHRFHAENLKIVESYFSPSKLNAGTDADTEIKNAKYNAFTGPNRKYGGLIFTSQRAVEAFGHMLDQGDIPLDITTRTSQNIILYSVGPATTRTLTPIRDKHLPFAPIHGDIAGNGEALAHIILDHYNECYYSQHDTQTEPVATESAPSKKPGLLFLVGEQRRDIIPQTLMNPPPPPPPPFPSSSSNQPDTQEKEAEAETEFQRRRITVDELVVYETAERETFESQFRTAIEYEYAQRQQKQQQQQQPIWVVIFSPTGCAAVLRTLGILSRDKQIQSTENNNDDNDNDDDNKAIKRRSEWCRITTIGPTTRDYLLNNFGYEPDVVARRPSPEGVGEGIREFLLQSNTP